MWTVCDKREMFQPQHVMVAYLFMMNVMLESATITKRSYSDQSVRGYITEVSLVLKFKPAHFNHLIYSQVINISFRKRNNHIELRKPSDYIQLIQIINTENL